MTYHLFPFDKVPKNSRIVLYGAGNVGKQFYDQITETNFCEIVLWLDKNADGIFIKQPETVANLNVDDYDIVVIAIESDFIANDVKILLINYGVPEKKILHKIHGIINEQISGQLRDFQRKTNLNPKKINTQLQSAEQNNHISCAIYPFEAGANKYTELMKNILQKINIKPTDDLATSNFIWLHWFESITSLYDLQQKIDFLKKCKEMERKIIWNVHNKQPHETTNVEQVKNLMKLLAQSAHKIVIHSKMATQMLVELCENDEKILQKIIWIPIPHYAGAHGNFLQQNILSNDKLKILFFGLIRPYKNIELLIKVFNDSNFNNVELNICGYCSDENYKQNLLNLIKSDKIKSDFRFITDGEVVKLLAQNHILLLPYSLESSLNSSAAILAFSYSRSVISSLTGTLDDIDDKSLFFTYDYKTPEEHEQKLKEILTQIREKYHGKYDELLKLGEKCRENVLENNSHDKVASALAQVFNVKIFPSIL